MRALRLLAVLAGAAIACAARGDIPHMIPIQGVLKAPNGQPKPDGTYGVVFRLYDAPSGGNLLYTEPASGMKPLVVSGGQGLFTVALGDAAPYLAGLAFDKPYYLSIQVTPDNTEMAPRIALGSAPYALRASSAQTAGALALPFAGQAGGSTPIFHVSALDGAQGSAGLFEDIGAANPAPALLGTTGGTGPGVEGQSASGAGVLGQHTGLTGTDPGVRGETSSTDMDTNAILGVLNTTAAGKDAAAVRGNDLATNGAGYGVFGYSNYGSTGVFGRSATGIGVRGSSVTGEGVRGDGNGAPGVHGISSAAPGVLGENMGGSFGVQGKGSSGVDGVRGDSDTGYAVEGQSQNGTGVKGLSVKGTGIGVDGYSTDGVGVRGGSRTSSGVYGNSNSNSGVYGQSGSGPGVLGQSLSNVGVHGDSSGNVGVYGTSSTAPGLRGDSTSGYAVYAVTSTGNLYAGDRDSTRVYRVDNAGKVYANGGFQAYGADFAELMPVAGLPKGRAPKDEGYAPGDVLVLDATDGHKVERTGEAYCPRVAGIIATQPGVVAAEHGIEESSAGEVPMAMVGQVPCHVTNEGGPVRIGDLLVTSSTPGCAMRAVDRARAVGCIVGKAMDSLPAGTHRGTIRVLVSLQ